jgi:hypothetical protein
MNVSGQYVAAVSSILLVLIVIFFPIFSFFIISENKRHLEEVEFKKNYGSMYSEFSKSGLYYNFIFVIRRLVFSITAIFLNGVVSFQIHITIIGSLLLMCYNSHVMPYKHFSLNGIEQFNEWCIYATCVLFYIFTDYVDNPTMKWNVGWAQTGVIALNFAVNVVYIIY